MPMIDLTDPAIWAGLLSLTALEIVLGIDNIVFLAVLVAKLPKHQQELARRYGLIMAFGMRIALLMSLFWVIGLTKPVITLFDIAFSWRDFVLIAGGLFLIAKATHEIHSDIEHDTAEDEAGPGITTRAVSSFGVIIAQIAAIDLVFSIDSIITAIGISDHVEVMITAIIIAMLVMYFASGIVGRFIEKHPTTKMLALSFLLLVGMVLVADGLHVHIPRGFIYFAMAFAGAVEVFNILARRRRHS
jgi:predicted tellurium resistance membrane protein TerC